MTRIVRVVAVVCGGLLGITLLTAPVSASEPPVTAGVGASDPWPRYGPYSSEGTCNYYMYAVRNTGQRTSVCYYWPHYPSGWYFDLL